MSKNKMEKMLIQLKDLSIPKPRVDRHSKRWVSFGANNLAPEEFIYLAKNSNTQSAILRSLYTYAMGAGFEDYDENIYTPNLEYDWEELVARVMKDFIYMGAFALQATLSQSGKKVMYSHIPVSQVRLGNYDENNHITTAYLSANWLSGGTSNIIEMPMWGSEMPEPGTTYLMYFKEYDIEESNLYYGTPYWFDSANWILADILLSKFYLNTVGNGFTPSTAILFPDEPSDPQKKEEIYESLLSSFGGVENAGNIIVLFGENGVTPEIKSLSASDNPDLYEIFIEEVKNQIITGNNLSHPMLASIQTKTGFSSQSEILLTAYAKYKLTMVNYMRNFVLNKINGLLKYNGYKPVLNIIDFNLRDEIDGNVETNEEIVDEVLELENNNTNEEIKDDE